MGNIFFYVAGKKNGVPHSQDNHEQNSSSQLDSEGNFQPADFVSLLPSQQIILDIYRPPPPPQKKKKRNVAQRYSKPLVEPATNRWKPGLYAHAMNWTSCKRHVNKFSSILPKFLFSASQHGLKR